MARKQNQITSAPCLISNKSSSIFQLCYADIIFFHLFNFFAGGEPTVPEQLKEFPLLVEHYNRVLNVPEIKAWVEKRPKTEQ